MPVRVNFDVQTVEGHHPKRPTIRRVLLPVFIGAKLAVKRDAAGMTGLPSSQGLAFRAVRACACAAAPSLRLDAQATHIPLTNTNRDDLQLNNLAQN